MTNAKTTKRALYSSLVALLLCFTMLLGTTYAWFTDSATSAGNKIVTGNLDVELYLWTEENGEVKRNNISENKSPVLSDSIIWEPGRTEVVYLSIRNEGSLDLKYKVALDVSDSKLVDVMEYAITPDAKIDGTKVTAWNATNGVKVNPGKNATGFLKSETGLGRNATSFRVGCNHPLSFY